jgi:hypothetical protein
LEEEEEEEEPRYVQVGRMLYRVWGLHIRKRGFYSWAKELLGHEDEQKTYCKELLKLLHFFINFYTIWCYSVIYLLWIVDSVASSTRDSTPSFLM